jgi:hypothetical protein
VAGGTQGYATEGPTSSDAGLGRANGKRPLCLLEELILVRFDHVGNLFERLSSVVQFYVGG